MARQGGASKKPKRQPSNPPVRTNPPKKGFMTKSLSQYMKQISRRSPRGR